MQIKRAAVLCGTEAHWKVHIILFVKVKQAKVVGNTVHMAILYMNMTDFLCPHKLSKSYLVVFYTGILFI